jgi:hypothetical protein
MIVIPKNIGLQEWADVLVLSLSAYGTFSKLLDEKDWQTWAEQFALSSTLQGQIPNPAQFDDWHEWAERLCGALS